MWSEERRAKFTDFGDLFEPSEAAEPILARGVRDALMSWLTEIWAADELMEVGISPRRKAIFDGAPGVGKTTLAHHLAARLGLHMLAVRPERLIHKWLGSTGRNIGALFDLCAQKKPKKGKPAEEPVVLFLDEFDAIGFKRKESEQGAEAEQNAWINTLLQRLEQHDGFVIAATNFGSSVDQAIWRRFDMHITLDLPGQPERERILARYLSPFGLPKRALASLAESFETASPALMRAFCENLKRQIIIGPKLASDMRKGPVVERILAGVHPHPDLGKPRLWSHGAADEAVRAMPWPLPKADEIGRDDEAPAETGNVVTLGRKG